MFQKNAYLFVALLMQSHS